MSSVDRDLYSWASDGADTDRMKARQRARSRALNRLRESHEAEFARLFDEELETEGVADTRRRLVAECGTRSGYNRHRRLGEESCERCRRAVAAYMRQYTSGGAA